MLSSIDREQWIHNLRKDIKKIAEMGIDQYVEDDAIAIPSEKKDLISTLKEIISKTEECCRIDKKFVEELNFGEEIEFFGAINFIAWLRGHLIRQQKLYDEAAFVKEMNMEEFKEYSKCCFDLSVDHVAAENECQNLQWSYQDIQKGGSFIMLAARLYLESAYTRQHTCDKIKDMLDIDNSKCAYWIQLIEENKDSLWRRMLFLRLDRIETRIGDL